MSTHFNTLAKQGTKRSGIPGGFVRLGGVVAAVAAVGAIVAVTFAPIAAPTLPATDASISYVDGRAALSSTSAPSDFWAHTWDGIDAQPAAPTAIVQPVLGYETYDIIARPKSYADLATVGAADEYPGGAATAPPVLAGVVPFDETRELSAVPSLPSEIETPRYVVRETNQGYEITLAEPPSMLARPAPTNYDS